MVFYNRRHMLEQGFQAATGIEDSDLCARNRQRNWLTFPAPRGGARANHQPSRKGPTLLDNTQNTNYI